MSNKNKVDVQPDLFAFHKWLVKGVTQDGLVQLGIGIVLSWLTIPAILIAFVISMTQESCLASQGQICSPWWFNLNGWENIVIPLYVIIGIPVTIQFSRYLIHYGRERHNDYHFFRP